MTKNDKKIEMPKDKMRVLCQINQHKLTLNSAVYQVLSEEQIFKLIMKFLSKL